MTISTFIGWVGNQEEMETIIADAERGFRDEHYETDLVDVDSEDILWIEGDSVGRKQGEIFISSYHATEFPRDKGLAYVEIEKKYYPFFATVRELVEHYIQKLRNEQRCQSTE